VVFHLGAIGAAGVVVVLALLAYEHSLLKHDDLSKLNAAFFAMNGAISVVFFFFVAAAVLLRRS
jgi:4-hydroxybenzoate polyprenyltransferase